MRGAADGFNAESAEKPRSERTFLDRAETQAAFERQLAEEPARPLAQIARVRPADVLAARALARFLEPPRARAELPRLAAAKALDGGLLHAEIVGASGAPLVPRRGDTFVKRLLLGRGEERFPAAELDPRPSVRLPCRALGLVDRLPTRVHHRVDTASLE